MDKKSYYQGTKDPKDKPKAEKSLVVYPGRFKEPFYQNYDLYDTPEGDRGMGPGTGLHGNSRKKFKSLKEFIDDKRKRMKGRYVAVDEYRADDQDLKKKRKKSIEKKVQKAARMVALNLIKNGHSLDREFTYPMNEEDRFIPGSGFGGVLDRSLPQNEMLGGSPLEFGYSREYFSDPDNNPRVTLDENYAKAKKRKAKKKRIKKIYNLLDRMTNRGFYGYPYGYGGGYGYGRGVYNDNRSYTTNDNDGPGDSGDSGGGDSGGGDSGGGDGGGGGE